MDANDQTAIIDPVETKEAEYMLTTVDNPYDPFTQFENWLAFDEQKGYNTNGLLARLALTSNELSDEDNEMIVNHAVDDILELFPGLYKKVTRS